MSGGITLTGRTRGVTAAPAPAPVLAPRAKPLRPRAASFVRCGKLVRQWWNARPDLLAIQKADFYRRRAETHLGVADCEYACVATVRGVRCRRPAIPETEGRHCVRHAGPFAAVLYRARRQRDVGDGRLSIGQWEAEEHRRARTAITNRQRRRKDGWLLPGVTLRLAPSLEDRFQTDLTPWLDRPWGDVPDHYRDRFRWAWRKFMLDRTATNDWELKAVSIRADLRRRGDYDPEHLEHDPVDGAHVLVCTGKAPAWSWRSKPPRAEDPLAWLPRAREVVRSPPGRRPRPVVPGEDEVARLLWKHGRDLRDWLARLPEAGWPLMLAAWDEYAEHPTAATHKRWLTLATGASAG